MTNEEKQLLLKDLCARLSYGIKGIRNYKDYETVEVYDIIPKCRMNPNVGDGIFTEISFTNMDCCTIENFKPYLRSLSNMTKEEREEVQVFICDEWFFEDSGFATKVRREGYIEFLANYDCSGIDPEFCGEYVDWLNTHHFDYRGLIEKGLALEAPEGMYKME